MLIPASGVAGGLPVDLLALVLGNVVGPGYDYDAPPLGSCRLAVLIQVPVTVRPSALQECILCETSAASQAAITNVDRGFSWRL